MKIFTRDEALLIIESIKIDEEINFYLRPETIQRLKDGGFEVIEPTSSMALQIEVIYCTINW